VKLKLADGLSLPVDTVTQTIAILAKRRAGKSYTMRRLAEQLFKAGQQLVLVDPKGDQWGIRSAADGKGPGLSIVILGGERGDVPLEPSAGEVVAKLVVEERVSILLDLSLFRKHELATFMTAFLENLYRLKAREIYRTPVMLVIDEADAVAPQKPQKGEERMLGAAEDIVRRGGQRGIGCVLVTQRSAVLNKNVLTQAQMLVALRTIAPQDLAAMDAWIQVHGTPDQRKTLMESLPSLPVGDAWFWSPGWPTVEGIFKRVHVLPIETFDSGATPKPGEKPVEPKHAADVDLDALKRQMAATIEKAKADDPRELRKQIAELKKQLEVANRQQKVASPASLQKRVDVLTDTDRKLLTRIDEAIRGVGSLARDEFKERIGDFEKAALAAVDRKFESFSRTLESKGFNHILAKLASVEYTPATMTQRVGRQGPASPHARRVTPAPVTSRPARVVSPSSNGHVSGAEQRILNALAELAALGVAEPERVQVAFFAGYTHLNSKGLVNALGALRSSGYIDYPTQGRVTMTPEGQQHAEPVEAPRSADEIRQRVVQMLGGASARILDPLIEAYPNAMSREDLAAAAQYGHVNSKGFVNALGRLRSLGFIDYPQQGQVAAQPVLFLES